VAVGAVSAASAVAGAGWMLARSFDGRSQVRASLAIVPPSARLAGDGLEAGARGRTAIAAISPGRVGDAFDALAVAPLREPDRAVALIAPPSPRHADPEPEHTGSIAPAFKLASIEAAPASRPPVHPRDSLDPTPLPRARPQLAALTPADGLPAAPEAAHPPRTAVYDITARTVYLPSGERLEAHSGLGEFMDDPRHVHLKMRGSTPPNTYKLTLREALFHGVQALRMTPVGDGDMFKRDGILAHSYLLGPSGQSNGCISFKDYPRFLEAYMRGEVDRVVVVARLDRPPVPSGDADRIALAPRAPHPVARRAATVASVITADPPTLRAW
jgi:hypothetical protein